MSSTIKSASLMNQPVSRVSGGSMSDGVVE